MTFNPPIDPAYTRFVDGLKQICEKLDRNTRWDARKEKWVKYDPKLWGMEDLGLADTSPGLAFVEEWILTNPYNKWNCNHSFFPDLFARVRKAGQSYIQRYPQSTLVWVPWGGGDWRATFSRTNAPPPPPPPPPPTLSKECLESIMKIQDTERRGLITHDQARQLIQDIVADCT